MHTIEIFLASSKELEDERKAFETFIARHGSTWMDHRETRLKLNIWEDFYDAVSDTRKQDDYDRAIERCQIFVMMFWTKVGKYTNEEFDVALKQFKATGFPLIYTYFKNVPGASPPEPSLAVFKEQLKSLGHFETQFESTDGFLLHFSMQLEKIYHKIIQEPLPAGKAKAELLKMAARMQFPELFEELIKQLGTDDLSLNAFMEEFIHPPANFNPVRFAQQLKVFISRL